MPSERGVCDAHENSLQRAANTGKEGSPVGQGAVSTRPDGDEELLARVRNGDLEAFGLLWKKHRGLAHAVSYRTDPYGDHEDVVSSAFERILVAVQRGSGPTAAFGSYLALVVRRTAIDRATARIQHPSVPLPEDTPIGDTPQSDLLEQLAIQEALDKLPPRWREILELLAIEGHDIATAAARMGISYGAAAITAMRARNRFREIWTEVSGARSTPEPADRADE